MNFKTYILFLAMLPVFAIQAQFSQNKGQNLTKSPYSNFGLGEILNQNLVQAGALSQTYSGAYSYSLLNPATISNLKYATFDFGFSQRNGYVQSGSEKQTFQGGSLSYLALGFQSWHKDIYRKDSVNGKSVKRITKLFWNSYLSLYPSTSIGYNYTFEATNPFKTSTAHEGKGGLNAIEFGNGFKLGKHLALGYAVGNLFGQMSDKSRFVVPDSSQYLGIEDEKVINIRGWQQTVGAMYSFNFDSTYHRLSFSYRWQSGMRAQSERLTRTFEATNLGDYFADTILSTSGNYKSFKMPASFGFGYYFQFRKGFAVGLDYRKQLWGNYASFFQSNAGLTDRTDYGLGFIRNPEDEKNPAKKRQSIPIRFGGKYAVTQNAIASNNTKVAIIEKGAYIGFGIPITRRYFDSRVLRSIIHVQVDYLQRGKNLSGLANEEYVVFTVGLNLGDVWFQRRKFD